MPQRKRQSIVVVPANQNIFLSCMANKEQRSEKMAKHYHANTAIKAIMLQHTE